jgi:hypothetical protein
MERFISLLIREWGVIKQAPVTFVLILVLSLTVAFSLSQFLFSHIVAEKDATIEELQDRPPERTAPELATGPTDTIQREVQATPTGSDSAAATLPGRADLPYDESLTPDYLVGLYKGRTDLQGDALAGRYIEKFDIGMNGRISTVSRLPSGDLSVMLILPSGSDAFAKFSKTSPDLSTLSNLRVGDQISILGPLEDVNRRFITLRDSRIVWLGKEPTQK